MRIPLRLSIYISRYFLISILVVLSVFTILIFTIDTLELVRRAQNKDVPFGTILQMSLFKYPSMGQRIMPFVMLIATVVTYSKLTKNSELIVVRAAGVSVWQFLMPSCATAFFIGVLMFTTINPIATLMVAKYERLEAKFLKGKTNYLDISNDGIWLRQLNTQYSRDGLPSNSGETIIHARNAEGNDEIRLSGVTIFVFEYQSDSNTRFVRRIDAQKGLLLTENQNSSSPIATSGFWHLNNVIITDPEGRNRHHEEYFLETNLTASDIQDSFAEPETISFWQLNSFIETLKKSGFSAIEHKMYWHSLLSTPLLYASMIFIAAIFSMPSNRQGKPGMLILASIFCGFFIYFFMNLIASLGISGAIPVIVAAWLPVAACLLLGIGLLLHLEDG